MLSCGCKGCFTPTHGMAGRRSRGWPRVRGWARKVVIYMQNLVRQLRGERGLTQEDLADKVDVSRQTIISIESGRYNPSIVLAYKIAKVFGRSIEEVFLYEAEVKGEASDVSLPR